jgi:hypothetical protein
MLAIGSNVIEAVMLWVLPERRYYRRAKYHGINPMLAKERYPLDEETSVSNQRPWEAGMDSGNRHGDLVMECLDVPFDKASKRPSVEYEHNEIVERVRRLSERHSDDRSDWKSNHSRHSRDYFTTLDRQSRRNKYDYDNDHDNRRRQIPHEFTGRRTSRDGRSLQDDMYQPRSSRDGQSLHGMETTSRNERLSPYAEWRKRSKSHDHDQRHQRESTHQTPRQYAYQDRLSVPSVEYPQSVHSIHVRDEDDHVGQATEKSGSSDQDTLCSRK